MDHDLWFTTENVKEIPVEIIDRQSDDLWIKVQLEASKEPFQFDERPPIRFILIQSQKVSELIILCHNIICDELSLAYLARDIMTHLGEPTKEAEILPHPVPIEMNNLPNGVSLGSITKFFVNRINNQWKKQQIDFDQEDYLNINEAYWSNAKHRIISVELNELQTTRLIQKCREENVTVNSALATAFSGAQQIIQGDKNEFTIIGITGNLRDNLRITAGEGMGFYAGVVTLYYPYNREKPFWENAQTFNKTTQPLYTNKNLFKEELTWCYLEPAILEAFNFKKLGYLVSETAPRYDKLSAFSNRVDLVSSILKRENMETFNEIIMGTTVTNLTNLDFPRKYGDLELNRLIMTPGGAFPLTNVGLVLGAVTCSGKLSLVVKYDEGTVETETILKVKEKVMSFLLEEVVE